MQKPKNYAHDANAEKIQKKHGSSKQAVGLDFLHFKPYHLEENSMNRMLTLYYWWLYYERLMRPVE